MPVMPLLQHRTILTQCLKKNKTPLSNNLIINNIFST